jgi:DNA polymerase-3 subunit delta
MRQKSQSSTPNILKEIQAGKVNPVYLLCGEESFLIENTLKRMLDLLLDPTTRDFNLNFLDGVEVGTRDILSAVEVYPVMSDWRVVVVSESTVFKARKETSQLDLIRNAIEAVDQQPRKAIALMGKVLGISAQEIADQSHDFEGTIGDLIAENRDSLSPDDLEFLHSLPQIATQVEDLHRISEATDETELLLEWLDGALPKSSVLIFTFRGNVDARSRLVKAINRVGRYVSFAPPEVGQSLQKDKLFQSVSRKLEDFGKKISPGAFNLLQKRTGNNMRLIFEEVEKLLAFVGTKTRIDERDIQTLVAQTSFDSIFALTDAIGKRSVAQALSSLHSVLDGGEPPIKVNALIARQARLMLQAKLLVERGVLKPTAGRVNYQTFVDTIFKPLAAEMSNRLPQSAQINLLKQNPYAAYKVIQSLPYFGTEELIQGLEKTLDADIQLKSSYLDPESILEQLVYELCARSTARR